MALLPEPFLFGALLFFVPVTDAVERFDLVKVFVEFFEFFADTFYMGIYCSIIYIDILTICRINQLISVFYVPGPGGEGLEEEVFCHGEVNRRVVPCAKMARIVEF